MFCIVLLPGFHESVGLGDIKVPCTSFNSDWICRDIYSTDSAFAAITFDGTLPLECCTRDLAFRQCLECFVKHFLSSVSWLPQHFNDPAEYGYPLTMHSMFFLPVSSFLHFKRLKCWWCVWWWCFSMILTRLFSIAFLLRCLFASESEVALSPVATPDSVGLVPGPTMWPDEDMWGIAKRYMFCRCFVMFRHATRLPLLATHSDDWWWLCANP